MGNPGTLMGVSRRLKEFNRDIKIVGRSPCSITGYRASRI
jgi:cysteine synthase